MAILNQTSSSNLWKQLGCMVSTSSNKKNQLIVIANELLIIFQCQFYWLIIIPIPSSMRVSQLFLNFQLFECLGRLHLTLALHLQPSISLSLADYIAALVPRNSPPNHWLQKWQPYWLADRFPMMYPYTRVGCVNDMSVSRGNSPKRCLSW